MKSLPSILSWVIINSTIVVVWAGNNCEKKDSCLCEFKDGSGYDLSMLVDRTDMSKTIKGDVGNLTYIFHPCWDVSVAPDYANVTGECGKYSICLHNQTENTLTALGHWNTVEFKITATGIYLLYALHNVTTLVQLGCSNVQENILVAKEPAMGSHSLLLFSTHACLKKLEDISTLSTGSVLVITFFLLVFSYFTIGVAVGYFLAGARGIEVIPHLDFWKDLPSLVMDGASFVQNGCKPRPSDLLSNHDSYASI